MLRRHRFSLLLLWVVATALPADPTDGVWPPPRSVSVLPSDLAFARRDYEINSSESIFIAARLNDGWVLMANLFEFRNPLFKKWGVYVTLSDPAGRGYWFKHDIHDNDVRWNPRRLSVSDGANSIDSGDGWYRLVLDIEGFRCDLTLSSILPAWKPGSGIKHFGRTGTASATRILGAPWAVVSGSLTVESRTIAVQGQGTLEKNTIVAPLNRQESLLYSMRLFSPDATPAADRWYVGLLDITSHPAYGPVHTMRLELARGGDWLFTTPTYTLEPLDMREVPGSPYPAPGRVALEARQDGYHLRGVYRAGPLFNLTDVIEEVPKWIRPIVKLLIQRPVYLRFVGEFEGSVTYPDGHLEPIHLYGPYEYVVTR